MPKWQISLTRDASQDASVIIEAETADAAEKIFLRSFADRLCVIAGELTTTAARIFVKPTLFERRAWQISAP